MPEYRRQGAVVEARLLTEGTADEAGEWCDASAELTKRIDDGPELFEGLLIGDFTTGVVAHAGDWIVRDAAGEFAVVKPDVFEADYEPVLEAQDA